MQTLQYLQLYFIFVSFSIVITIPTKMEYVTMYSHNYFWAVLSLKGHCYRSSHKSLIDVLKLLEFTCFKISLRHIIPLLN